MFILCISVFNILVGVMWTLTDAIHAGEDASLKAPAALSKIDTSGVLFFLGILLSVGALDSAGLLTSVAQFLDQQIPNQSILATAIGFASALIDNVPLVAATMGMYPLDKVPADSSLWQLIAFCAGTGGSIFVVGSAAGVALMGLENVDFLWYAKKISISAVIGYLGGIGMYSLQQLFFSSGANEIIAAVSTTPSITTGGGII
jgi:Na+/H+ antiporter NhaD/arsenite permease-like protein